MKKVLALLLTVGLICGALYLSNRRRNMTFEGPESAVWRMLDESRSGSVEGYLDCFTGAMRAQLEMTANGMTLPRFSEYLKESAGKVKGVAVYGVQQTNAGRASLTVEYIYPDHNERQRVNLRLEQGRWRVEAAESSQRVQPLIPYGKPVTDLQ